jgi:long-chain acyl-CoA synthetase
MGTIPDLFIQRVSKDPDAIFAWAPTPDPEDPFFLTAAGPSKPGPEGWSAATFGESHAQVAGLASRLASLGVGRGTPVAIWAETSARWALIDLAIQCLGGITVGIYPTLLDDAVLHQLTHSGVILALVDDETKAQRALALMPECPALRHIFSLHPTTSVPQLTPARPDLNWLAKTAAQVRIEDVATHIYTSGTTGTAKAVVLNHHNFTSIIAASRDRLPLHDGERSVVFLPLAHVLQRFTIYRGLVEHTIGWFSPSIAALPETIRISRPHVLATVPRMLEKIRAQIEATAAQKSPRARSILDWAIAVGRTVNEKRWTGKHVGIRLKAQHALAERLVATKVRHGLGGHLRLMISGGAALDPDLATWFEALGIAVREGWGLSETTAPATLNGLHDFRFGTVGKPLDGTTVLLADDGEILLRGPGVFQGYLHDPDATAAAFRPDGFFRTGDLGIIEDGFVRIIGRKKEIIVTIGGKNIAPVPIEAALEGGLIDQAIVVGDERPYLVALLAPDITALTQRAETEGWPGDVSDWVARQDLLTDVACIVEAAMANFPRFEQIKKWTLLNSGFTEDKGMLTPTLKLKRSVIQSQFADTINHLYI